MRPTFQLCLLFASLSLTSACGPQLEPLLGAPPDGGFTAQILGGGDTPPPSDAGSGPTLAPITVVSNRPGSGAPGAGTNTTLGATFSRAPNPATIDATTFTVFDGLTPIRGTVGCSGRTATFAPAGDLPPGTVLTAILSGTTRDLAGQPMGADYFWTFRTGPGPLAPAVIATVPPRSATGVDGALGISATFSTSLDAASLTHATFAVTHGGEPVDGALSYAGGTATFLPAGAPLEPLTTYEVTLTGMTNAAGESMASDWTWSFTTAPPG